MEMGQVPVGPEGKMKIDVVGGKIVLQFDHVHASGKVTLMAEEDLKYFLEALKPKLPAWAQVAVAVVEGALP